MTRFLALLRKELAALFLSPIAYGVLTMVALVTALVFFEHLSLYNKILFLFQTTTMGGFESDTIPNHINLRDSVFNPVMDQLSLLLVIPIPLVTMRVFAEERARGTEETLVTTGLSITQIVAAKFAVTFGFAVLMMMVSFVYPVTAIAQGGLGAQHLFAVFLGLTLLAIGIASIGLACSAFTTSQIVAAAAAVALAFLFYDFGWTHAFVSEDFAAFLDAISLRPHFRRFAEGLVFVSDIAFFGVMAVMAFVLCRFALNLRRVAG
ncbi:MAG: ABC transporter permease [Myxococcota bacterium]|nr:ABC transporter permease [Myxococcota bacterium]